MINHEDLIHYKQVSPNFFWTNYQTYWKKNEDQFKMTINPKGIEIYFVEEHLYKAIMRK